MITVERLTEANEDTLKDILRLIAQLRRNSAEHTGSLYDIRDTVANEKAVCIVAKDGRHIVGVATLYILVKVGKRIGYVEDVVVDEQYRGQGLGKKLMESIIDVARKEALNNLFLTSSPARTAANNLYQKLGFEIVETNPYMLKL
ncbi:MAG TPA: GNAT family N-acetyltransferase [Candidatus Paceibacterota bacterium]